MIPYHAAAGEVEAVAVPRAGGNAGSTESNALHYFARIFSDCANVANSGDAHGNDDDNDGALPPLLLPKQGVTIPMVERKMRKRHHRCLAKNMTTLASTRACAESSC